MNQMVPSQQETPLLKPKGPWGLVTGFFQGLVSAIQAAANGDAPVTAKGHVEADEKINQAFPQVNYTVTGPLGAVSFTAGNGSASYESRYSGQMEVTGQDSSSAPGVPPGGSPVT